MAAILDYQFQEVPIGTGSLPFIITPGSEILITSIFLHIFNANNKVEARATIGWEAQLLITNEVPLLTFRIRRGGTAAPAPIVFQATDGAFLGTPNQGPFTPIDFISALVHSENVDPTTVGTFQQYALTVEYTGIGSAKILGPVNLSGTVIG